MGISLNKVITHLLWMTLLIAGYPIFVSKTQIAECFYLGNFVRLKTLFLNRIVNLTLNFFALVIMVFIFMVMTTCLLVSISTLGLYMILQLADVLVMLLKMARVWICASIIINDPHTAICLPI